MSLLGASSCVGQSRVQLRGSYSVEAALDRLLAGAPCTFRMVDARTVRILPAPPPSARPQPAARPVATVSPLVAPLTVTASKRRTAADRLAAAISVIPARQLEASGAGDPGQTTGMAAGVVMTNLGPGRDKLLMRGISDGAFTGRARSTVGTYLDDAPINYNAPDPDLRLVDIERIEVVRGPQGALYGAGSLSGVYRIVTRKPDTGSPQAGLQASYAVADGGSPSWVLEGYLSAPVIKDRLAVRAVLYREVQGGYLDDVAMRRSNVDETVRQGGRLAIRAQASPEWTVDLSATVQRLRSADTQYTTGAFNRRRANRVAESHKNDFTEAALSVRGSLPWGDLTSSTAVVRHNYESQYDASAAVDLYAAGSDLGVYSETARMRMLVQDLVLTSRGSGRLGWLAGLYGSSSREDTPNLLRARAANSSLSTVYRESRRDRLSEIAAYGEVSYEFTPRWTVALGARAFHTQLHVNSTVAPPAPYLPRALDRKASFEGVSPKLSIQRELGSGDLVYALYSEGYRAGGINSAGLRRPPAPLDRFSPDRLRNHEVGGQLDAFDGRLSLRGAAFYDIWRNVQTDQYLAPSGLAYTANVGDARITGLEGEVAYDFDFGLSLRSAVLVSRSKLMRPHAAFAQRLTKELPGAPRVSGGVLALYERPLAADLLLRLVGEASYVGRSNLTFERQFSPRMGDYVRARLSAQLAGPRWRAELYVTNPADDSGDTFAYGNPFSFGQVRQVTPQRPRTLGLSLAASF